MDIIGTSDHVHDLLVRVVLDGHVVHSQDAVPGAQAGAPRGSVLLHRLHVYRVVAWNITRWQVSSNRLMTT